MHHGQEVIFRRAKVLFFFKQWGGVNKKRMGKELQGRTCDEMPMTSDRYSWFDKLPTARWNGFRHVRNADRISRIYRFHMGYKLSKVGLMTRRKASARNHSSNCTRNWVVAFIIILWVGLVILGLSLQKVAFLRLPAASLLSLVPIIIIWSYLVLNVRVIKSLIYHWKRRFNRVYFDFAIFLLFNAVWIYVGAIFLRASVRLIARALDVHQ